MRYSVEMYLAASNAWLPVAEYDNEAEAAAHAARLAKYRPSRVEVL